jgi:hypothetical protein
MLSYETPGTDGREGPELQDVDPPAPFLTERQRAMRAIVVGLVLGAVLGAFARRA